MSIHSVVYRVRPLLFNGSCSRSRCVGHCHLKSPRLLGSLRKDEPAVAHRATVGFRRVGKKRFGRFLRVDFPWSRARPAGCSAGDTVTTVAVFSFCLHFAFALRQGILPGLETSWFSSLFLSSTRLFFAPCTTPPSRQLRHGRVTRGTCGPPSAVRVQVSWRLPAERFIIRSSRSSYTIQHA